MNNRLERSSLSVNKPMYDNDMLWRPLQATPMNLATSNILTSRAIVRMAMSYFAFHLFPGPRRTMPEMPPPHRLGHTIHFLKKFSLDLPSAHATVSINIARHACDDGDGLLPVLGGRELSSNLECLVLVHQTRLSP